MHTKFSQYLSFYVRSQTFITFIVINQLFLILRNINMNSPLRYKHCRYGRKIVGYSAITVIFKRKTIARRKRHNRTPVILGLLLNIRKHSIESTILKTLHNILTRSEYMFCCRGSSSV